MQSIEIILIGIIIIVLVLIIARVARTGGFSKTRVRIPWLLDFEIHQPSSSRKPGEKRK